MERWLEQNVAASGFAAAVPPGDPTFAMRKRIADLAWRARQLQIGAGITLVIVLCMIAPTFGGVEHSSALPPTSGYEPYIPENIQSSPTYGELFEATMHAKNLATVEREQWYMDHVHDLTPVVRDVIHFQLAQMARNDGDPREVAAQLGAMQGHWSSFNEIDGNVARGLIEFVRANDLMMPLRQAEKIAINATRRDKTFLRDSVRPAVTTIRWVAALIGLCGVLGMMISLRTGRLATELLDRAKALR